MESFLTGSIPNLQFDLFATEFNGFDLEINPNGRDEGRVESIVTESKEDTGLANAGVAD